MSGGKELSMQELQLQQQEVGVTDMDHWNIFYQRPDSVF